MSQTQLQEKAWRNFCEISQGWIRHWGNSGRFDVFISLTPENVGEPFSLSVYRPSLFNYSPGDEIVQGWNFPERHAIIGLYLGRKRVYEGQKRTKMTFATPTKNGRYKIYVAHSGILSWFGDGEDEPCQQSGIRVDDFNVTNPQNTQSIEERFGEKFRNLGLLVKELSPQ
jgi:hypothetical protein